MLKVLMMAPEGRVHLRGGGLGGGEVGAIEGLHAGGEAAQLVAEKAEVDGLVAVGEVGVVEHSEDAGPVGNAESDGEAQADARDLIARAPDVERGGELAVGLGERAGER